MLEGGKQAVKIGGGPAGPLYTEQAHCQRVYYNGEIAVIRPILSIQLAQRRRNGRRIRLVWSEHKPFIN